MPSDAASRVAIHIDQPAAITPGGEATFTYVIENTGDTPLPLTFRFDANPPRVSTVRDGAGKDLHLPTGPLACPDRKGAEETLALVEAAESMKADIFADSGFVGRSYHYLTLAPKGRAHARVTWTATGRKWGQVKHVDGRCTGDTVSTPLAPGSYSVTIQSPELEGQPLPDKTLTVTVAR
jgi:hypothetical protein